MVWLTVRNIAGTDSAKGFPIGLPEDLCIGDMALNLFHLVCTNILKPCIVNVDGESFIHPLHRLNSFERELLFSSKQGPGSLPIPSGLC